MKLTALDGAGEVIAIAYGCTQDQPGAPVRAGLLYVRAGLTTLSHAFSDPQHQNSWHLRLPETALNLPAGGQALNADLIPLEDA